jgi:S-DNA-T family DNA segregation ATPase FtsK/SpoIIIE
MNTDRGTCVAVGVTDATFELVRTFYVPFEDGVDDVSPVIARVMVIMNEAGRAIEASDGAKIEAAPADHLADIADVMRGERRVRTQVVLTRLAEHNPAEYEGWSPTDLTAALADHGVRPGKSHGVMVIRAEDISDALGNREARDGTERGETDGEPRGTRGVLPDDSLSISPCNDLRKRRAGRRGGRFSTAAESPPHRGSPPPSPRSLPDPGGGGADDQ